MNDLLKEARESYGKLCKHLTIYVKEYDAKIQYPFDFSCIKFALDHYEELLKKEEGVKPIKTYKRIGTAGECVEETYNAYECECGYTLCDDYAGTLELPNYCEKCGAKIKRSDT